MDDVVEARMSTTVESLGHLPATAAGGPDLGTPPWHT